MDYGIHSCFGRLRWVLMHKPEEELQLVTDPSSWGFQARPNWNKATKEFNALYDVLKGEKVKIDLIEVGPDVPPPNLYFTRDLGVCTTNGIILSYFRHEYRQGEELFLEAMADQLDIPVFGIVRDGYFEGGDLVFLNDKAVAIGLKQRTNQAGFQQMCEFLDHVAVPALHEEDVHLDAFFNVLNDSLALAYERALSTDFLTFLCGNDIDVIPLTAFQQRHFAADVILLEENKVIIGDDCDEMIPTLKKHGVEVISLPMRELKKGSGGPGSLILPLLRK
ncbi:hypothetical protein K8R43_04985 [archaeon]|nr:hypothetical protein [archaeon]